MIVIHRALKFVLAGLLLSTIVPTVVGAQQSVGGPKSGGGQIVPNPVLTNLTSEVQPDGSVKLRGPENYFSYAQSEWASLGWANLALGSGRSTTPGRPGASIPLPGGPPGPAPTPLENLGYSLFGRSSHGSLFESSTDPNNPDAPGGSVLIIPPTDGQGPTPPTQSGAYNVRSTRRDMHAAGRSVLEGLWRNAPLPTIAIRTNPRTGIVAIPTWYWVDRQTYAGQPLAPTLHLDLPFTVDYDVDVTDESQSPCPDNADETCTTRTTHTDHHIDHYLDQLDLGLTFTPARYTWDFGDGRPGSQQDYDPATGLGLPAPDASTPSPVAYTYEFSSLDVLHDGGFPVELTVSWGATFHMRGTSDAGGGFDENGSMNSRSVAYGTRYQVREVRSVVQR